jgi:Uma2 family endonuclease
MIYWREMHATIPEPFPQTEPATEFIHGRLVQKMSPRGLHARVQGALFRALDEWADERASGRVGTEWDFDLTPPGEDANRLVPDVAYLSYERVAFDDDEAAEIPTVAPNVGVEVLSPGQTMDDLAEKVRIYLAAGMELVMVVDPRREIAVLHDRASTTLIHSRDLVEHPALPGFSIKLSRIFAKPGARNV